MRYRWLNLLEQQNIISEQEVMGVHKKMKNKKILTKKNCNYHYIETMFRIMNNNQ